MASYQPIRDITRGKAKLLEDVDPELVVQGLENTKSYMPLNVNIASPEASTAAEEQLKGRLKMDVDFSLKLLEGNGWGNGTRLPFANKENHELEKILEIKQRRYLVVQTELRDNTDHLQMLEGNFARASEDILAYHNLLLSKKKLIEEERNLYCLAERFFSRVVQDTKNTEKALRDCRDRCDKMKKNQERRLRNLTELRDLIEFDREALQEYHQRLANYQNQKLELGRIIQEDSKTVELIDQTYVELGAKRKSLKLELDSQAMNSSKSQEQLDRLSVEFRKVYKHRQEMLTLWSTNIESAKRKDAQMNEVADDYFEVRERIREVKSELDFRERQYRNILCGMSRAELHISELDKKCGDIRRVLRKFKDYGIQLSDSIIELQLDIRATAIEEKNFIARAAILEAEEAGQEERLARVGAVVDKLREKLNEANNLKLYSDQNITELEKILNDEDKRTDNVHKEMELMRKFLWERSNDKKIVTKDIIFADMAIHRLKGSLSNCEQKEYGNMEFLARQSAKVYRLDLESSTLENKLSRVENQAVNPHYYLLQTEVAGLRDEDRELQNEKRYITKELSGLEQLIQKSGFEVTKYKEEKTALGTELLQINMFSQRTQKLIDWADKRIQDLQVENSLETVNFKRLNDGIKLAKEQLFGLSEERKTFCAAVSERKQEIENNRALNFSKSKALIESVGRLKVQILEMEGRTHKLKGRFELVTKLMVGSHAGSNPDDGIGQKVREAARVRESLQLELRKWESRVEEAKQELVGLENVLKLLQASNVAVKDKLMPITEGSTESQELELLEQEEKAIHVRKGRATRFRVVLFDKLEDLEQQIAVMEQETQATAQLCKMKGQMASKIENELHRQKDKVQRWSSLCCKLLKEVKPIIGKDNEELLEKDLKLRFMQEKIDCGFNMLDRLINAFPDYKAIITSYFEKHKDIHSLVYRLLKPSTATASLGQKSFSMPKMPTIRPSLLRSSKTQVSLGEPISTSSSSRTKSKTLDENDSSSSVGGTDLDEEELKDLQRLKSIYERKSRKTIAPFQPFQK